jgi:hypothetical protein
MPGGRGVKVVNTVLFDIVNVGKCFRYRTRGFLGRTSKELWGIRFLRKT